MGIRGLQTFVNGRLELLTRQVQLKDCNVLLDGNSICHQSYTREGSLCIFGGEYDKFYRYCIKLFEYFRACSINVVVVFDGPQLDDRKLETSLDRARERITKSSSTDLKVELSPLLLRQVFLSVLDTSEIPYVSALSEADGECASLANHFDCFLIAQDSDYFCYYLVRGYIPFDSVTMIPTAQDSHRITAQLYHINSLINAFPGLQLSTLILACCLCGNDYVSRDLTQSILDHLVRRVYVPQDIERTGNIQTKYLYYSMQWMRKFDCFDTALQQTCDLMNTTSKNVELQNKLRITVQSYFVPSDTLINRFISSKNSNIPTECYFVKRAQASLNAPDRNNNLMHVTSKGGHSIPPFICDAVSNLCLSPSFIEILIHRRLICKAHVEVEHEPSIYEHAIPLLRPCLAILLKWDQEYVNPMVDIYQRVTNRLETWSYPLKYGTDDLPELGNIESMSIDERQHFVKKYFHLPTNPFQQWNHIDEDYHFWLMIIRYWFIRRGRQPVFLYAVIVCLIKTVFLRTDYEIPSVEEQISSISCAFGIGRRRPRNYPDIRLRLKDMCKTVKESNEFDNSIVYELNCLQTIYMYSSQLNEFFNKPFPSHIHPHYFISGTLFYAFVHHYRHHNNLSDALRDLFSQKAILLDFTNNLYQCINF